MSLSDDQIKNEEYETRTLTEKKPFLFNAFVQTFDYSYY